MEVDETPLPCLPYLFLIPYKYGKNTCLGKNKLDIFMQRKILTQQNTPYPP